MMKMIRALLGKSRRVKEAEEIAKQHVEEAAPQLKILKRKADAAELLVRKLQKDVTLWH